MTTGQFSFSDSKIIFILSGILFFDLLPHMWQVPEIYLELAILRVSRYEGQT